MRISACFILLLFVFPKQWACFVLFFSNPSWCSPDLILTCCSSWGSFAEVLIPLMRRSFLISSILNLLVSSFIQHQLSHVLLLLRPSLGFRENRVLLGSEPILHLWSRWWSSYDPSLYLWVSWKTQEPQIAHNFTFVIFVFLHPPFLHCTPADLLESSRVSRLD